MFSRGFRLIKQSPGHKLLEVRARHPSKERLEFVCYGKSFYCLSQSLGEGNWGLEVRLDERVEELKKVRQVDMNECSRLFVSESQAQFHHSSHCAARKPRAGPSCLFGENGHTFPMHSGLFAGQKLYCVIHI